MGDLVFPWKLRLRVDAMVFDAHNFRLQSGRSRQRISASLLVATSMTSQKSNAESLLRLVAWLQRLQETDLDT